ncbi:MAG: helix-turn-helix transcriptional regulator [Deltaproteobacteria bacterium]|nr:helix-turn-helix transcriptional regulator [Deltaproteobacteria bacterium]
MSCYETGTVIPSIETLMKIAKVLNKTTSYFLD